MSDILEAIPASVIHFLAQCAGDGPDCPETKKRQVYRLLMMLRNGSHRALRLSEMFDRGEISGDQLLAMVD